MTLDAIFFLILSLFGDVGLFSWIINRQIDGTYICLTQQFCNETSQLSEIRDTTSCPSRRSHTILLQREKIVILILPVLHLHGEAMTL